MTVDDRRVPEEVATVRQRIAGALAGRMLTAREISRAVGAREKEVLEHLPHVARGLSGAGRFEVEPSSCLACGFKFRKRERLKTPGKCPVCRSEKITETRFGIAKG
jgi:predicted Zn-ribbon and HTH transcriptional regulator